MPKLSQAAVLLMIAQLNPAALAESGGNVTVARDEEVMFVNGARLQCESDCQVRVLDDGSMRIGFPEGTLSHVLRIEATVQPVRLTLQAGDRWMTYRLDDGRGARFDSGRERGGYEAVLLHARTEAEVLEEERMQHAPGARDESAGRYLARTPLGRRPQEVGSR